MKFYTNVAISGSNVLIREVVDGVRNNRKLRWTPTVFVQTQEPTGWTSLYGDNLKLRRMDSIPECRDFVKKLESVNNLEVFGQLNYSLQFLNEYEMSDWSFGKISCYSLDIETKAPPGGGFPKPEKAEGEINLITLQDIHTRKKYTFGTFDYKGTRTNYIKCVDEVALLKQFLLFWQQIYPDVLTGWNVEGFDVPYLINRIGKVLGQEYAKKLSPWGIVNFEVGEYKGKADIRAEIVGISVLDMMDLMKKYTYGNRESWSLGAVAQEELGRTKLENPADSFVEFYTNPAYHHQFVEYNVIDAELVTEINDKMLLLQLALTIAYKARVNYTDIYSPVKVWDAIIHNTLYKSNVVVPQRKSTGGSAKSIEGAYVKEPVPGVYENVSTIDATSLYPSIMELLNLSPETFIGMNYDVDIDAMLKGKTFVEPGANYALGANGAMFSKEKLGFIPMIISDWLASRKTVKGKMLALESEVEALKKQGKTKADYKHLSDQIAALNNEQMAIKIAMNSLYGAMANAGFRFFDQRVAESITLTGQLYLRSLERDMDQLLCDQFKVPVQRTLIYADTDSAVFCLDHIIKKFAPDANVEQRIKMVESITRDHIQRLANVVSATVDQQLNVYKPKIYFKQEIAADRAIWMGKKKYVCRVHSSEGVRYTKPKFKVMGLEMVRSSTPKVIRQALRDSLEIIFDGGESAIQDYIKKIRDEFVKMTPEEISRSSGANNLDEYSDADGNPVKGAPYAVKAALVHNQLVQRMGLHDKVDLLKEGDRVRLLYLNPKNPTREKVIAWSVDEKMPKEFGLHQYIDVETQFQKTFVSAIEIMITPLGWTPEPVSSLEEFFA